VAAVVLDDGKAQTQKRSHTRAPARRKPRSRRRKRAIRRRRRRARTERPPQQVAVAVGARGTASSPKIRLPVFRHRSGSRASPPYPPTAILRHAVVPTLAYYPPIWSEGILLDFVLKVRRRNDDVAETSSRFRIFSRTDRDAINIALPANRTPYGRFLHSAWINVTDDELELEPHNRKLLTMHFKRHSAAVRLRGFFKI